MKSTPLSYPWVAICGLPKHTYTRHQTPDTICHITRHRRFVTVMQYAYLFKNNDVTRNALQALHMAKTKHIQDVCPTKCGECVVTWSRGYVVTWLRGHMRAEGCDVVWWHVWVIGSEMPRYCACARLLAKSHLRHPHVTTTEYYIVIPHSRCRAPTAAP